MIPTQGERAYTKDSECILLEILDTMTLNPFARQISQIGLDWVKSAKLSR